jgi:hypothetical protein
MLYESYHPRGPREYLSKWRGNSSWLSMAHSLFLSRPELYLYNCLTTEHRLTELKSADPQIESCNNLISNDYIDRDMQTTTLLVASHCGSVRLAKHYSQVRVSRISITMPLKSGTESSADWHISLNRVSNTTSMIKDKIVST